MHTMIVRIPKRTKQHDQLERQFQITSRLGCDTIRKTIITLREEEPAVKSNPARSKSPPKSLDISKSSSTRIHRRRRTIIEELGDEKSVQLLEPSKLIESQSKFSDRIGSNLKYLTEHRPTLSSFDRFVPTLTILERNETPKLSSSQPTQEQFSFPCIHSSRPSIPAIRQSHQQKVFLDRQPRTMHQHPQQYNLYRLSSSDWKLK